jgi:thiamine transport system substrate-binding protein
VSKIVPALVVAVLLAACTSTPTSDRTASPGGTVTLVSYDSYAISKATLKEFTAQTGQTVDVVRAGDAAEVVNRAILTKSAPEGDVLFGVDNNLLSRALAEELFASYQAEGVDQVPAEFRLDPVGHVTPIDLGDVCVNSDREFFDSQDLPVPKTLTDLADPQYRDLLVVENPATSTPGLAFLLATVAEFGPDGYIDYWSRLRENGVEVENSWDSAYYKRFSGGSGGGDRPLVVSYASSPPAEVVFAEEELAKAPTGVLIDTCYRQIEFAGLMANAPNPAGGQQLIDFMLTPTYQQDLPLNNFVFPVLPQVELPKVFEDNAALAPNPLSLPPSEVAGNRDAWVAAWIDAVVR